MQDYKALEQAVIDFNLERMTTQFKRVLSPNQVAHFIPEEEIEAVFERLVGTGDAYTVSEGSIWDGIVFSHHHCVLDPNAQTRIIQYIEQVGRTRINAHELVDIGDEKVIYHTLQNMFEQGLILDLDRVQYGKIDSFVAY